MQARGGVGGGGIAKCVYHLKIISYSLKCDIVIVYTAPIKRHLEKTPFHSYICKVLLLIYFDYIIPKTSNNILQLNKKATST